MEKLRYRAGKGFFKAMAKTQDCEIETLCPFQHTRQTFSETLQLFRRDADREMESQEAC